MSEACSVVAMLLSFCQLELMSKLLCFCHHMSLLNLNHTEYLVKITNYEVSHCAVFSLLLLLPTLSPLQN